MKVGSKQSRAETSQAEPILAERIGEECRRAAEVIKDKGDNKFLGVGGTPYVGV